MRLLQNAIALVVFVCVAALLIYVGVYILLAVLIVGAVAFAWYGVKFYFLRKEIQKALHEHQSTGYSDAFRTGSTPADDSNGPVIDGDFEEVDDNKKP